MTNNFSIDLKSYQDILINDLGIVDTFVSSETADKTILICHKSKMVTKPSLGLGVIGKSSLVYFSWYLQKISTYKKVWIFIKLHVK